MKIIQLISGLGNGGAEKFVVELSNHQAFEHAIVLCSFSAIEDWMQFPKRMHKEVKMLSFNKKKGLDLSIYGKLYRLIKTEKPDVLHFHLDATLKYVLPFVLLFPRIKFVHTLHSDLNKEKKKIFSQLDKVGFVIKKVRLVCITHNIKAQFVKNFGHLRYAVIENGVDQCFATDKMPDVQKEISHLRANDQTLVFVSVGRLDENKNQELLMQTFQELIQENVINIIIGSDPSNDKNYQNRLLKIKPSNVFFLGEKDHVADYLKCSDVFVMTSLNEGLPVSVLEAFSNGLPVISTPAGGVSSLIEQGFNGFLSEDFSVDGFKTAIRSFLKLGGEERKKMSANSFSLFLSKYHMEKCAASYIALYKQ